MSKMIPILMIVVIISSVQCFDWCPYIEPNGQFEGLGIYHHFKESGKSDYFMFNRAGSEWKIVVDSNLTLNLDSVSIKSVEDKGLVNKFGTFTLYEEIIGKPGGRPRTCSVITTGERSYQIVCRDENDKVKTGLNSTGSFDFVIMKVQPKVTRKEDDSRCLIFKRTKKSDYFVFNPFVKKIQTDCKESKSDKCEVPLFVDQIDDSLFAKIDGIIDFSLKNGPNGHIILFNIDGQSMYCSTLENENLSDMCNSTENMKKLFDECFYPTVGQTEIDEQTEIGGQTEQNTVESRGEKSETTEEPANIMFPVLIISILVVIVLVIIVSVVLYRRSKSSQKKSQIESTENSLNQTKKGSTEDPESKLTKKTKQ